MSDHEESQPLTRREMRLREMATRAAESEVNDDVNTDEAEAQSELAEAIEAALLKADIEVSVLDEQGRLRTRRELRELRAAAEAEVIASVTAEYEATRLAADALDDEVEPEVDHAESGEAAAEPTDEDNDEVESADESEAHDTDEPVEEPEDDVVVADDEAHDETEAEAGTDAEAEGEVESDDEIKIEPDPAPPTTGYSFPDIAPLDEGGSVFDDPALRLMNESSGDRSNDTQPSGDFDDLINRAVAQESGGTSNTSALILPNMPGSENLSGPLGETGELFITGSFDLPKSLSETGGHSALHDSVEIEPLDELGLSEPNPTGNLMAPVAASRAVSMRSRQGPLVAEATKDKSKLPVVFIATGGALVVGAVALIIWAAASGMFG